MFRLKFFFIQLICGCLLCKNVFSQSDSLTIKKIISKIVNDNRKSKSLNISDINFLKEDPHKILEILKTWEGETSLNVKFFLQTSYFKIGKNSADSSLRKEVTNKLMVDCLDSNLLIKQQAIKRLLVFNARDFSGETKKILSEIIRDNNIKEAILIAGIAQMRNEIPVLTQLSQGLDGQKNGWYASREWYATIALARMGGESQIVKAISTVESVADDILRVTKLLGDIAYIRQTQAIKLLQNYLYSEQRLPPLESTIIGLKFNQYALEFLSQSIEGFPIVSKGLGYTEEEIALARTWMKKESNYKILR